MLELVEEEVPPPNPVEVRVVQRAVGLNFIDTYHRSGLYEVALPSGLGLEAAGVVEAVGAEVRDFREGDRVAYAGGSPGAYASARCVPAERVVPIPKGVSEEEAAAVLLKGMTVEYLVRRVAKVTKGDTVLWHAAAGGVGLIACQWLRDLGATVIGTAGTSAKADLAKRAGCSYALVYTEEDIEQRVCDLAGDGVHVVFDSVGKDTFKQSLACLRRRGMMVAFGNASGPPEPFSVLELTRRGSLFLTRPSLVDYTATREELLESAGQVFHRVQRGVVHPEIHQKWPLAEAAKAHRSLHARETVGSSLLIP